MQSTEPAGKLVVAQRPARCGARPRIILRHPTMCMVVYSGSDARLRTWPFDAAKPGFHVTEVPAQDEAVKAHFSKPHVYYAGAFEGCGCGFQYGRQYPEGDDDPDKSPPRMRVAPELKRTWKKPSGFNPPSRFTHAGRAMKPNRRQKNGHWTARRFRLVSTSESFLWLAARPPGNNAVQRIGQAELSL